MSYEDMRRKLREHFDSLSNRETVGDWLRRIISAEEKMSEKALRYLTGNPIYQRTLEAIHYQVKNTPAFLDRPLADVLYFRYWVPSKNASFDLEPKEIDDLVTFWSNPSNVIKAELAMGKLNKEIAKRQFYGVREEVAPASGHILSWSNAGAEWSVFYQRYEKGEVVRMDANEIFAPYDRAFLWKIAPYLDPLPLYYLSFEAKQRGLVEPHKATFKWVLLQYIRAREEELKKEYR